MITRPFPLVVQVRAGDIPKLTEKLLNAETSAPRAFADALYLEALRILDQAKRFAPYRTGRLYRSGRAYRSGVRDPRINVQFLAPYASAVEANHPTKSRFLARAVEKALPGMARRLTIALGRSGVFGGKRQAGGTGLSSSSTPMSGGSLRQIASELMRGASETADAAKGEQ